MRMRELLRSRRPHRYSMLKSKLDYNTSEVDNVVKELSKYIKDRIISIVAMIDQINEKAESIEIDVKSGRYIVITLYTAGIHFTNEDATRFENWVGEYFDCTAKSYGESLKITVLIL